MHATATTPVIEFLDVSYRVAGTEVLSGLRLQVHSGETLVLLGRSGSGKTTTLKLAKLGGEISDQEMQRLNYAVDGQHRDVKEVVHEFLTQKKLVP